MHIDEEVLQRLLHAELDSSKEAVVEAHLADCTQCRERAAAARRDEADVLRLLATLDGDQPRVEARHLIARAHVRDRAWIKWAAGVLFTVGVVGTAYAAPGSPVPRWVAAFIGHVGSAASHAASVTAPERPAQSELQDRVVSGLSMAPDNGLLVLFMARQPSGQARVLLTDAGEVSVQSFAHGIPFRSEVARLVVDNRGTTADFEVLIPHKAQRVEIRVGSELVYLKIGARVTTALPADSDGARLIPLGRKP